eukprot:scaffold301625_cov22-Tisochrysis_lutea.AAC.1
MDASLQNTNTTQEAGRLGQREQGGKTSSACAAPPTVPAQLWGTRTLLLVEHLELHLCDSLHTMHGLQHNRTWQGLDTHLAVRACSSLRSSSPVAAV